MNKIKKNNRNIALMVHCLERGGMERVAAQLSEMLSSANSSVYLFVLSYKKEKAYYHKGKIVVCQCNIDSSNRKNEFVSYYINARIIAEKKREYEIDTTISFGPEMNLLNILSGVREKKILTFHNCMSLRDDIKNLAYTKEMVFLGNFAHKIVPVCNWVAQDLSSNYFLLKRKINVIYNPAESVSNIDCSKDNIVLAVGRLDDVKQQWHIIKVFKCLLEVIPNMKLVIIGNGPNQLKLEKLAEKLNVHKSVTFPGFVKDVGSYYSKSKVLILSSKSEAFPCAVIEGLSYGVPVVSSDCPGGIRECMGYDEDVDVDNYPIEMHTGYITRAFEEKYEPYSTKISTEEFEMADAIKKILTNEMLYKKFSNAGKMEIKRFSKDRIKKSWLKLLNI